MSSGEIWKIVDFEVLDAIKHWRDGTDGPGICRNSIGEFQVVDNIEAWRNNSDFSGCRT